MRLRYAWLYAAVALAAAAGPPAPAQDPTEVFGTQAAVVADQPLAAAAAAEALRRGGNAVDAAVAAAAVLTVVRPHMNGIGGDNFMLIYEAATGEVHALNGSGRAGSRATPEFFREQEEERVPSRGVLAVTVPGAVRGWEDALERFGTQPLSELLQPAIRYARDGFPVTLTLAHDLGRARNTIAGDPALAAVLLDGEEEPPAAGALLRQPDLARSLELIAGQGADAFYRGELARRIVAFMEAENGPLTAADLAEHASTWQAPIETAYAGRRILTFPPNTQGVALLMQLNMGELFDLPALGHNSADYVHTLAEIKRVAFADRNRFVSDPEFVPVPVRALISKDHAHRRARDLRLSGPPPPEPDPPAGGDADTIYLCVVDKDGNAVSMIQSIFASFGSGRMVPETGIVLHNRGSSFRLDGAHVNVVAPGKRPYHTLLPVMGLRPDGSLAFVYGCPGGDAQAQTAVQVLNNLFLFGMSPQEAVTAPRWRSAASGRLSLETGFPAGVEAELERRQLEVAPGWSDPFGAAQLILIQENGLLRTGADPRREAYAIAW